MTLRLLTTIALTTAAVATPLGAQAGTAPLVGRLAGVVLDTATGGPVRRASICTMAKVDRPLLAWRCSAVDTLGQYRLDNLPLGPRRVSLSCETIDWREKLLASDSVALVDSSLVRRDWTVSTTGCDKRPLRRVTGTFRGYYRPGFESSEFVPCESDAWFVPGDSLGSYPYDARRAWAEFPRGFMQKVEWPITTRDRYGNPRYYVRWHGTVVGPGRYGHMGVSPFEIAVDTLFVLREPTPFDCRAVGRPRR